MNTALFALEAEIIARLAAELPDVHLFNETALPSVLKGERLPAVVVSHVATQPADERGTGFPIARLTQNWMLLCAAYQRPDATGPAFQECGALADRVFRAIQGWRAPSAESQFVLQSIDPERSGGAQAIPLVFTCNIILGV